MPELKTSYLVEAAYVEGAAEKRGPYREDHLARLEKLAGEGVLVVAGALADLSASVFILSVHSEDAVKAIVETDAYWKGGVWTDYSIRKMNRVIFE
ncbi:MAG: YciI family protein [Actinomycetota bacterium]